MMRLIKIGFVSIAAFAAMGTTSFAQTPVNKQSAAVAAEAISTVFAFNRICYAQVPDVEGIGDMAKELIWQEIKPSSLKDFETGGELEVLRGWDAQIGQRVYRVAISQGPLLETQAKNFPDFASGKSTSCTMVLDGLDPAGVVSSDMQELAGKEPITKDIDEGGLKTTTWAGGNDDIKVFLISKSGDENGGLLNVTVLTK